MVEIKEDNWDSASFEPFTIFAALYISNNISALKILKIDDFV